MAPQRELFGEDGMPPIPEYPTVMAPLPEGGLAELGIITAIRALESAQNRAGQSLQAVTATQHRIEVHLARQEAVLTRLENVEGDVKEIKADVASLMSTRADAATLKQLETELDALKEDRQRRAGMLWIAEFMLRYFPWLLAAAASIWVWIITDKVGKH